MSQADGSSKDTHLISCRNCRHYYITWDKNFPYGCRALNFKSKSMPAAAVRAASGIPCLSFARKEIEPD